VIGYLRGRVIERHPAGDTAVEVVLDVGGVGYRVLVSPRLAASLTLSSDGVVDAAEEPEQLVALSVHTHVREGAITLYGFVDTDERRAFEILLGAHGVGPALALAVVAVHGPARLVEIVAADDVDSLTLVPGVGRKTAMRLLVDLKSRFGELDGARSAPPALPGSAPSPASEVVEALAQLGYGPDEIRGVTRMLPSEGTTEDLLRTALRELARRR
jgi:holliday junction DNA helicase RuvA